ncbi:hypothetical protein BO85DRAFT_492134 [Aspergillus piperis CBS 112811]|uniref:Protein kinase domain-containing protein n=1 Tax=Aspergillus piperis CBS 112811 TaxID=1448313 RepID=A0A8G1QUW9_9EURO|nr:hypothetical protein BO85DRAFT_492134 [Aspergillus piperis CBS 112811]RAH53307.1 hypothetical protein BO85DRAFT_492134 [Aspergillus piperis CBS 112811]
MDANQVEVLQIRPDQIVKTSHENLVNLEEAYLGHRSIVIAYDSYGISLEEIRRASNIFFNDASAVACICRELLKGLKYIHDEVGITHGNLSCCTVVLTDRGQVKITDVGDGMVRGRGTDDRTMDNRAVGQIAATLLRLDCLEEDLSGPHLEAESFIHVSSIATVDELLNHRFLQAGFEPWCLQSLAILSKVIRFTV